MSYNTLALSGGGVKGLAFAGAAKVLFQNRTLENIKHFYGTSIGCIVSTLLAAGFEYDEIYDFAIDFDVAGILSSKNEWRYFNFLKPLYNLYHKGGLYDTFLLENFVEKKLEEKLHVKNISLAQFSMLTGNFLQCNVCSISSGKIMYLDNESTPNVSVSEAVGMAISIPFIFEPKYLHGNQVLDGAILQNLIIPPRDKDSILIALRRQQLFDISIGMAHLKNDNPIDTLKNLFMMNAYGPQSKNSLLEIKPSDMLFRIDADNYFGQNFDISIPDRVSLINKGIQALCPHCVQYNVPSHEGPYNDIYSNSLYLFTLSAWLYICCRSKYMAFTTLLISSIVCVLYLFFDVWKTTIP